MVYLIICYFFFMKFWFDVDAASRDVKEVCYRASERLKLETVLVANQRLQLPLGYVYLAAIRVDGGPDVADLYIAEHASAGDVAVTADIPLASRCVKAGAEVISPDGRPFTEQSIGMTLAVRNLMNDLRSAGEVTGGPRPFSPRDRSAFLSALDQAIRRLQRARPKD